MTAVVSDMKTSLTVGTITFYLSYFDEYMLTCKRAEKAQKTSPYVMAEKSVWFAFAFLEDSRISYLV